MRHPFLILCAAILVLVGIGLTGCGDGAPSGSAASAEPMPYAVVPLTKAEIEGLESKLLALGKAPPVEKIEPYYSSEGEQHDIVLNLRGNTTAQSIPELKVLFISGNTYPDVFNRAGALPDA